MQKLRERLDPRSFWIGAILIIVSAIITWYVGLTYTIVTLAFPIDDDLSSAIEFTAPILLQTSDIFPEKLELLNRGIGWVRNVLIVILLLPLALYLIIEWLIENVTQIIGLIIVFILSIIFVCCSGATMQEGLEKSQRIMFGTPTPTPSARNATLEEIPLIEGQLVHYISVDINAPPFLQEGESHDVEIELLMSDKNIENAILVPLMVSEEYTATAKIQVLGFETNPGVDDPLLSQKVQLFKPVNWKWILKPHEKTSGNQSIAWAISLDDGNNTQLINSATIALNVQLRKPTDLQRSLSNPYLLSVATLLGLYYLVTSFTKEKPAKVINYLNDDYLRNQLRLFASDKEFYKTASEEDKNKFLDIIFNQSISIAKDMDSLFSTSDIKEICFDLNVDFENIPGTIKSEKIRNLIILIWRMDRLVEFSEQLKSKRPNHQWPFR